MSIFCGWSRASYSDTHKVEETTKENNLTYEILTDAIEQADYLAKNCRWMTRGELRRWNQRLIDTVADAYNAATAEDIERIDKIKEKIDELIARTGA